MKELNRRIDWFSLQEEEYISLLPDAEGIIRSRVFPGLWLSVSALVEGDMPSALALAKRSEGKPAPTGATPTKRIATLQAGLNSDAHQEFVQQLLTSQNPVL
ncbi:hypothetical protein [Tychonema sp. LEGE 07203]|uniref:hypothetical protein n=1 Tax=Tychonema sp. LEGE 07203 TaxID=1828671 RepID=UPI00187F78DD|nr:hypothetical protein [Tychonema sp. LEGE 07203]MBE9097157.1 hypothetical protein [Tychonema sp. LEGE 07203]